MKVLTIALGLLMTAAGLAHFLLTRKYLPIVPRFLPGRVGIVIISGIIELAAGIGLFISPMRERAAFVVLLLMVAFLPLHAWDLFRDRPAISPRWVCAIRFALQFVLIYWSWRVWRTS